MNQVSLIILEFNDIRQCYGYEPRCSAWRRCFQTHVTLCLARASPAHCRHPKASLILRKWWLCPTSCLAVRLGKIVTTREM